MKNVPLLLKPLTSKRNVNILSIVIPIAVALLIGIRQKFDLGSWTKDLPHFIGLLNATTSVVLVAAVVAIKRKNIALHRSLMLVAFTLGAIFLVAYIGYHISNPNTPYGGEGAIRYVYYFFLISHIVLSIGVVYFVLMAMHYSLTQQFD
ncbi:MAG: DUF420 domain-containing protein, partial [Bacteroidota bacterium]